MSTVCEVTEPERDAVTPQRVSVLGIPVDNLTMEAAIGQILHRLDRSQPSQLCFLNADCVNLSRRNRRYEDVLCHADMVMADGVGLKLAASASGIRLRDNVNGTDLFPRLCDALSETDHKIFLLGARPGVAQSVCDWIARRHPGVQIAGSRDGYFTDAEQPAVIDQVAQSQADLLLVAFGAPRQDLWIAEHLDALGVKVAVGVGGLFDFYSGRIPRAPMWMRNRGLEWAYRLFQEPTRLWKRYLVGNPLFLARVAADTIRRNVIRRIRRPARL